MKEYEYVFEDMWQSRTHPAPELYSPVYDGRTNTEQDPFPYVQREHLRLLLQMMQSVVELWLRPETGTTTPAQCGLQLPDAVVLDSLCRRMMGMPSAKRANLPCTNDHVYEACRLISVLMIQSVEHRYASRCMGAVQRSRSLLPDVTSTAATTSILASVYKALEKTNLDQLWDKNIGLLYWVLLVFHCAAYRSPDSYSYYPYGHALLARVNFELTYSYRDWHGSLKPLLALRDLLPFQ
jgi:hypothetical protein